MADQPSSHSRSLSPSPPKKVAKTEYSQNVNTIRERKRIAAMDDDKAAANKARKADNQAKTRARAQAKKKPGFDKMSSEEQERVVNEAVEKIEKKRLSASKSKLEPKRDLLAMYANPNEFYAQAYNEASNYYQLSQDGWSTSEDDTDIEEENQVLLKIQEPSFLRKQDLEGNIEKTITPAYRKRLEGVYLRSWPFFEAFWKVAIDEFWEKIEILNKYELGVRKEGDTRIRLAPQVIKRLLLLRTRSIRNYGPRSDFRKSSDFSGVLFKRAERRYGFAHRRRTIVRPRLESRTPNKRNITSKALKCLSPNATTILQAYCCEEKLRPHHVFTPTDRAVFRNVAAWDSAFCKGDKIKLPGPAWLWPKNYDYEGNGFEPQSNGQAAQSVYWFMLKNQGKKEQPIQFQGMLKSTDELRWKKGGEIDAFDLE